MKNIVVVGCTSGIGLATAQILSADHHVIGISKTENELLHHPNIQFYRHNILSDSLDAIPFPEIIDGVVYAPGSINLKPFQRLSIDDFQNDFQINVLGAVKIIQQLLPHLKKSQQASIVLFSSVAAKLGMPFHASIAASKSAVEGLTKSLAAELAAQNIRVNAIAPSLTSTKLAATLLATPEKIELAKKRHPLQRIGNPQEIAEMVAFLLAEKSAFITGQIIAMDGGLGNIKL